MSTERLTGQTRIRDASGKTHKLTRRKFTILVESGRRELEWERSLLRIGAASDNDLILEDDFISAHHAELEVTDEGIVLRDLGSRNGTRVEGVFIREAILASRMRIMLGETTLSFKAGEEVEVALGQEHLCGLVGGSLAMRECFGQLERFAPSDAPVLLNGETGVGKERLARAIHERSQRANEPFEVLDCGAIQKELLEDELFGHVEGAFTGAAASRAGAFERANGGTLFLDEVGELPLDAQPRFLRVLETGELKRLGSTNPIRVNVRVIAATHRKLPELVAAGQFRSDLYYRISALNLEVPPLRQRTEDIPALVHSLLRELGSNATVEPLALRWLMAYAWPGNIRELRNVLARACALGGTSLNVEDLLIDSLKERAASLPEADRWRYHAQKERWLDTFERSFLEAVLKESAGNVSRAAELAGIPRQTVHRLMAKHRL